MDYTPFGHLTDDELLREVVNKSNATDLEIELMLRLEYWMEYADTLLDEAGTPSFKPTTKYKEAA